MSASLQQDAHAIVVGGGIVGVSAAYYLARRGHRVTLLEQGEIGSGASSGNAGIIAVGHPPLPRPGLVGKTIRWMLDSESPLYIPPRFSLAMLRWFWRFRQACTEEHFRYCMDVLARMGRATRDCFEQIVADEPIDCEYHRDGWRDVCRTEAAFAETLKDTELLREYGFDVEVLDGRALRQRDPAFRPGVVGAVQYTESAFTDPLRFLTQLADRARAHGAAIRTGAAVTGFASRGGRFAGVDLATGEHVAGDTLVLAAGIWSTALARRLDLRVPMEAGKGYHRNVTRPAPCPRVASVLAEKHVATTPMARALRLSGTVEFSGINDRLVRRRLDMLTAAAREYLEGIDDCEVVSEWCGLRPCTADGLPVVGWAPRPAGVFIATGHARMGFALGPVTGRLAAECILGDEPSLDITPLRVERFQRAKATGVRKRDSRAPAVATHTS